MFVICMMAWMGCHAQEYFEGTLKARSFENHSKIAVKFSKGMLINGARDAELHIQGKKMAMKDQTTNLTTIYDVEKNKLYVVFHNIKKALEMPITHFEQMKQGAASMKQVATSTYKTISGMNCRLYSGEVNENQNGAKIRMKGETFVCEELPIDPALAKFNNGHPYVGMKYIVDANNSAGMIQINSYTAFEVHEVIRGEVDGAIFEVPADYEIVDGTSNSKMLAVYGENNKVMKKNKKGTKEEPAQEIKFDINEEWDF